MIHLSSPAILTLTLLKIWHHVPEVNQALVYSTLLTIFISKNDIKSYPSGKMS